MTPAKLAELYDRALALHRQGQLAAAEALYKRILLTRPNHAGALHHRGVIALQSGEGERGVALIRKAVGFAPGDLAARKNLAAGLRELGKLDEAAGAFAEAAALALDADLESEAGNLRLAIGEPEAALAAFDRALALAPGEAALLIDRGNALGALRRWTEALESYDRALQSDASQAVAHYNRGNALLRLGRLQEALAAHDRAVDLAPQDAQARLNRSETLVALGRREAALANLDTALALAPDDAQSAWNRALLLLQLGRFEEGWAAYETRKCGPNPVGVAHAEAPLWDGAADLAGKTILLHWEQGFGDTLQFCRYAKLVRARGAQVILQVQAPLRALLAHLDPAIRVLGDDQPAPAFDLHSPLMSLPRAFGTTLATLPAEPAYLTPDPELAARWGERLGPRGERPRAGLVWRGAAGHTNDRNRSLPPEVLEALLAAPAEWVALHPDVTADETALLAAQGVRSIGEGLTDFSETAGAIANLDLIVAVDTSVAHLAGALGKPVWVLLPFNPDWRWLLGRADSPWYPSARVFRQPAPGDWDTVIAEVRAALG